MRSILRTVYVLTSPKFLRGDGPKRLARERTQPSLLPRQAASIHANIEGILWTKKKGFPHEQAIQSYKRSLELDPDDDETHHQAPPNTILNTTHSYYILAIFERGVRMIRNPQPQNMLHC
jgi:hypothetical protein